MVQVIAVVVLVPAIWVGVCVLLAGLSGWSRLAAVYGGKEARGALPDNVRKWIGGRVGGVTYQGCLVLGATATDVYIGVVPLFRPGHEGLRVPWGDVLQVDGLPSAATITLRFRKDGDAQLEIPRELFAWLEDRAKDGGHNVTT